MYIALMEDDGFIKDQITIYFQHKGYEINTFDNGQELLEAKNLYRFDLFLLDIDTPYIDGFEVLHYLRQNDITDPAIFVTAKNHISYVKKGYELGCNDYVKKPFDLEELELRIKQLVPEHNHFVLDENLIYDHNRLKLYKNGKTISFTQIETAIIDYFVKNATQLITYGQLQNAIWQDKDVSQSTIRSVIRNIRKKADCDFIQNHRGLGYRLKNDLTPAL